MNLQKPIKIRSKKIRQSAKGESCTLRIPGVCNHNPETVVFCHAPSPHKGTGSKSDDFWGAYGCSDCHRFVDENVPSHNVRSYFYDAIFETQKRLFEKGLIQVK